MEAGTAGTYRLVMLRVVAPLALLIVISSIDRVNISFAALAMRRDIGLDAAGYGLGAGLFFVGYLLFQLPSVAVLRRIGARRWISASVVGWGATAAALASVQTPWHFHALRVLLGAFESGFAPGVVWYVSRWLPPAYRGRSIALTLLAIPTSVVIGGPVCGWLLTLHVGHLPGWRLMFAVEGAATMLAGLAALAWFADGPAQARWLSDGQREWIAAATPAEETVAHGRRSPAERAALWRCAVLWLALVTAANGLIFWLPSAIAATGVRDPLTIGWLTALPWVAIGAGMVLNARHSDRSGERIRHLVVAMIVATAGLAAAGLASGGSLALLALMVGGLGLGGGQSVFWTVPTERFTSNRARAIALINLCGNAGSAVAPAAIGWLAHATGTLAAPVLVLAAGLAAASTLANARMLGRHAAQDC